MNKPKIRFKGYTEDWEQSKLGDMMNVTSVKRIHQSDWTDSGIRFLRARDIVSAAKNEEPDDYLYISKEKYDEYSLVSGKVAIGDMLVTGVGTIGVPYLIRNSEPLYFKDGNIIWFQNGSKIDGDFFFYSFLGKTIQDFINKSTGIGTVGTYTIESGKKTPITLPEMKEQQQIGVFFHHFDHLITLHQHKCDETKTLKKYMLQKMFPQNGANAPEIRFDGFTDAWEQRKFFELYKHSDEKNDGSIGINKNITVATMQYKPDIRVTTEAYLKTYYTFHLGDIAFEGHQSKEFRYGRFVENDIGDGIVSHIFAVFRPIAQYDLQFWKYLINSEQIMQPVLSRSTKASTMMHDLVTKDFLNESILVPSFAEQQKIGSFLTSLDHLITLHQRKLEKLQNIKKFMLEKMFI